MGVSPAEAVGSRHQAGLGSGCVLWLAACKLLCLLLENRAAGQAGEDEEQEAGSLSLHAQCHWAVRRLAVLLSLLLGEGRLGTPALHRFGQKE